MATATSSAPSRSEMGRWSCGRTGSSRRSVRIESSSSPGPPASATAASSQGSPPFGAWGPRTASRSTRPRRRDSSPPPTSPLQGRRLPFHDRRRPRRRAASRLQAYIRQGGGFVGIHAAADTEHGWPWYGELVGATFASHPDPGPGTDPRREPGPPLDETLPDPWIRFDEWYDFEQNPRAGASPCCSPWTRRAIPEGRWGTIIPSPGTTSTRAAGPGTPREAIRTPPSPSRRSWSTCWAESATRPVLVVRSSLRSRTRPAARSC